MSAFTPSSPDHQHLDQVRFFIDVLRKNLIDLRRQADMTQSELARRMYCSTSTVSNFERGEREMTLVWICGVCHILGVNSLYVVMQAIEQTINGSNER